MVGKKLRAFREFRGYSQIQLAEPVSYTHLIKTTLFQNGLFGNAIDNGVRV